MTPLRQRDEARDKVKYQIEEERFLAMVDKTDSCWNWLGTTTAHGYGQIGANGKVYPAYRVAYELFIGPIPETLAVDHLCRNRACVNPDHLEAVKH